MSESLKSSNEQLKAYEIRVVRSIRFYNTFIINAESSEAAEKKYYDEETFQFIHDHDDSDLMYEEIIDINCVGTIDNET